MEPSLSVTSHRTLVWATGLSAFILPVELAHLAHVMHASPRGMLETLVLEHVQGHEVLAHICLIVGFPHAKGFTSHPPDVNPSMKS